MALRLETAAALLAAHRAEVDCAGASSSIRGGHRMGYGWGMTLALLVCAAALLAFAT